MQASHESFVHGYFQVTRERIEDFLNQRWIPVFLEKFIEDATGEGQSLEEVLKEADPLTNEQGNRLKSALKSQGITDTGTILKAIRNVFGSAERAKLVLEFAEAAVEEIQEKRKSLLDPINGLERRTLKELRSSYAQIQEAQGAITGHLRSLKKVQDEQNKILKQVGLLEKRDTIVKEAVDFNESITGIIDSGKEVEEILKDFTEEIKKLIPNKSTDSKISLSQ
jgi:hypothetical protein